MTRTLRPRARAGAANRRVFEQALDREVARWRRTSVPVTLVVFDIDHFKSINDTLGHPAGDVVLRGVADALSSGTKGFDLAARLGGDEFAVVLPGCNADEALQVAERLRRNAAGAIPDGDGDLSAGAATLPDDALNGSGLLAAADRALYQAKRAGGLAPIVRCRCPSIERATLRAEENFNPQSFYPGATCAEPVVLKFGVRGRRFGEWRDARERTWLCARSVQRGLRR